EFDHCYSIQSQKRSVKTSIKEVVYLGADLPDIKASTVLPKNKRLADTPKNHTENKGSKEWSTRAKKDQKQEKKIEVSPKITLKDLVETEQASDSKQKFANIDRYNGKVKAKKDKNKPFTYYQSIANIELNKETFGCNGTVAIKTESKKINLMPVKLDYEQT
ncbi:18863_t:CDS:2, partial [Gigaspora rosea]